MKSKIRPKRPQKWPLDVNNLGSGWVIFFKNYIFKISASSWEKWAIARPCGQNFHLICPQRRCDIKCNTKKSSKLSKKPVKNQKFYLVKAKIYWFQVYLNVSYPLKYNAFCIKTDVCARTFKWKAWNPIQYFMNTI